MCRKRKKKAEWVDDGRVIANMNVEGMHNAIYRPRSRRRFDEFSETPPPKSDPIELKRKERWAIAKGVTLAFLLVALIFTAIFVAIYFFTTKVWFA